jgi:homoserine kinase
MRVTAPASTSNLGPGFDCLGAALAIPLDVIRGDGYLPPIVERSVHAVAGSDVPVGGEVTSQIPVGRGLGSSGACIAAGLMLGCAITGKEPDLAELLRLGTEIEGHPDNVAASLYGGITLVLPNGSVMRYEPAGGVRPMILAAPGPLATDEARKVLPEKIPRADAIANIARTSGLVSMLSGAAEATRERLLECTEDRIHQPYRAPLMPATTDAVSYLRGHGIAAAVSGAGPSLVCLVLRGSEDAVRTAALELDSFDLIEADWDLEGAKIIEA